MDLGLPNGLLWAKCNVGATNETDCGDYFMWGASASCTSTEINCSWQNYPYSDNGTTSMTKYNSNDNLDTLELCDDAAHVKMGGNWRMPTASEFGALTANTTNTWTSINGVWGRLLTGKNSYSNVTLFLPACGYRSGTSVLDTNSSGFYWSSLIGTTQVYTSICLKYKQAGSFSHSYKSSRYIGYTVRGVITL